MDLNLYKKDYSPIYKKDLEKLQELYAISYLETYDNGVVKYFAFTPRGAKEDDYTEFYDLEDDEGKYILGTDYNNHISDKSEKLILNFLNALSKTCSLVVMECGTAQEYAPVTIYGAFIK